MEESDLKGVRFAPSPTGRFHIGNLRTAWISHAWARALKQPWVLRFEDIDLPRVMPGAQEQQYLDLEALGLKPEVVITQSALRARHWEVFQKAVREGRVYPCSCSRKDVREALEGAASAPHRTPPTYSGRCRTLQVTEALEIPSLAWRFAWDADLSGHHDFIVARSGTALDSQGMPHESTFVPAYHWACAIDDWDGHYALLVRAHDLAEVAAQHRVIAEWIKGVEGSSLGFSAIYHTALVTQNDGHRLEKRTQGVTWPELQASGWNATKLVKLFERSFDLDAPEYAAGKVFGEKRTEISLRELGIDI